MRLQDQERMHRGKTTGVKVNYNINVDRGNPLVVGNRCVRSRHGHILASRAAGAAEAAHPVLPSSNPSSRTCDASSS